MRRDAEKASTRRRLRADRISEAFDTMAASIVRKMAHASPASSKFPAWLRWAALVWLVVWIPAYWHTWGAANFLHLCDIAVILTCVGMWTNSALLISSQAVRSLLVDAAWTLDAASRFIRGRGT